MPDPRDRLFAHFYDLEYRDYNEDTEFYVGYARALDSGDGLPVLELGCGTGRIVLAIAEAGLRVVGIDASEGMLEVCAARAEELDVSDRVTLVRADLRDLEGVPAGPYNMAYCALNTFVYLATTPDQLHFLAALRPLLVQHGVLLLDLTPPLRHLLPPEGGELLYHGSYPDPENGGLVHKLVAGYADHTTQTHRVTFFYDLEAPDGSLKRFSLAETFRWTGRYEMEGLLRETGYTLERVYGSYDLDEYTGDSERMIFVART